jgi:hypothetical protein
MCSDLNYEPAGSSSLKSGYNNAFRISPRNAPHKVSTKPHIRIKSQEPRVKTDSVNKSCLLALDS